MEHITLSDGEWKIMKLLWAQSPHTVGEIVKALEGETGWTKPTIFVMLKRLIAKGAVRMDDSGKLQYDFTENDERLDLLVECGLKPVLCFGFMPECIADGYEPGSTFKLITLASSLDSGAAVRGHNLLGIVHSPWHNCPNERHARRRQ